MSTKSDIKSKDSNTVNIMKIAIDTNIIHGDFYLKDAQIISLCETAIKCGIEVLIPQVVIDEFVNQYREKLNKAQQEFEKAKNSLTLFYPEDSIPDLFAPDKISKLLNNYKLELEKRLDELQIKSIPYPQISHKELVKRDLARKKPFQPSGKGYRDALIWESVCNKIENNGNEPDLVFINENTNDFFEKDKLHPDLLEDVNKKGLSPKSIEIYKSISQAIDRHIKPLQERLEILLQKYAGKDCIGSVDINAYILSELAPEVRDKFNDDLLFFRSGPASYLEDPEMWGISDSSGKITDIRLLNDNQIIVDIDATLNVEFSAFLHKADSYLFDADDLPNIMDANWNRHYMMVEDTMPLTIKLTLILDNNLENVFSHSVSIK